MSGLSMAIVYVAACYCDGDRERKLTAREAIKIENIGLYIHLKRPPERLTTTCFRGCQIDARPISFINVLFIDIGLFASKR